MSSTRMSIIFIYIEYMSEDKVPGSLMGVFSPDLYRKTAGDCIFQLVPSTDVFFGFFFSGVSYLWWWWFILERLAFFRNQFWDGRLKKEDEASIKLSIILPPNGETVCEWLGTTRSNLLYKNRETKLVVFWSKGKKPFVGDIRVASFSYTIIIINYGPLF